MTRRKFSHQRGPRFQHNMSQVVRAYLGLTQDDLATLMDVSRAAVSMDEYGTRDLPWPQVQLLHALHAALPAPDAPMAPAPLMLTPSDRDDLSFRHLQLTTQVYPLKQKLERLQVRLAQAQCWQQAMPQLRNTFPAENAEAHKWLDRFERRAASTLRTEAGTPALLQVRLAAIEFEMAEITRLLGDAPAPGS